MAFWNAPLDVSGHGRKALQAALAMRETLAELNASDAFGFGADQKVGIGIGIHTGIACVGNMGAETRFNYSAVGDAVNVAARIESACKEVSFDILVSESTARSLPGCALLEAGVLGLKGKSTRTRLFAVVGDEQVAMSTGFNDLQHVHGQLVEALRSRSPATRRIVNLAKLKATGLTTALQDFYRRISRRSDHFIDDTAVKTSAAGRDDTARSA
jgi:adenylate cyclase